MLTPVATAIDIGALPYACHAFDVAALIRHYVTPLMLLLLRLPPLLKTHDITIHTLTLFIDATPVFSPLLPCCCRLTLCLPRATIIS